MKEERELRTELTRMRNPYLEEEFSRRQARGTRGQENTGRTGRPEKIPAGQRRRAERQRKKRRSALLKRGCWVLAGAVLLLWFVWLFLKDTGGESDVKGIREASAAGAEEIKPEWTEDYLTVNPDSRPGEALPEVTSIFVHYTANRDTSAAQNRSYFESLKDTHETSASAHFIIGYDGEIIQCIPLEEIAYAVKGRNYDSVSIECCYRSEDGRFSAETEESLISLLAYLTRLYGLEKEDILRHYDCGGKLCPVYYVEHEEEWEELKEKVEEKLKEDGIHWT